MPLYVYFVLTLLIELPVVLWLLKGNKKEIFWIGFLLNLFTWPILQVLYATTDIDINIMEFTIAVTEGLGYWLFFKQSVWRCLAIGFLANGLSYGIGLLLF